jgi:hypothetical protein
MPTMQPEVVVGLASTGVAALAVATSTLTTILSLRGQRENTKATLEAQRALASIQEEALRERVRADAIRGQRAVLYKIIILWAEGLLGALYAMNAEQPRISSEVWHIDPTAETDIDLYASDVVHTRFNALRGLLIGLVDGSGFTDSPLVFWNEHGDRIQSLSVTRTPPLDNWGEQQQVRDKARDDALSLISAIRAEIQGGEHSGYFVSYRLDRD